MLQVSQALVAVLRFGPSRSLGPLEFQKLGLNPGTSAQPGASPCEVLCGWLWFLGCRERLGPGWSTFAEALIPCRCLASDILIF